MQFIAHLFEHVSIEVRDVCRLLQPRSAGALDLSLCPTAYGGGEIPELNITFMPAVIGSYEEGMKWKNAPVGKALVDALITSATERGFRQMVAVIGDSENVGSIGVHASLGFQRVGILRSAGLKFGRWVDVVYMQRALGEGDNDIPDETEAAA